MKHKNPNTTASTEPQAEAPKKITITRKIRLNIDCQDPVERKAHWETLYKWQRIAYLAANKIMSELYLQDNIKQMIYLEEGVKMKLAARYKKDPADKKNWVDGDPDGMLMTSRLNSTYQYVSNQVKGEIPMAIITALNTQLFSVYGKEQKKYYTGEMSLRNYKRDIPIPIDVSKITHIQVADSYRNYKFNLHNIPFKTFWGIDRSGNRLIWERGQSGVYKFCNSSIQIKAGKIYLLAAFQFDKEEVPLDPAKVAEASLSVDTPISVNIEGAILTIGTKEEFFLRRQSIQAQRRNAQREALYCTPQHGRRRRMENLDRYTDYEKNYVTSKIHLYSNRLIKYCVDHQCGTVKLMNQTQKEEEGKEEPLILRNWSYFQLKEMIIYKAAKVGVQVIIE